jgi:hypothetical protein
MGSWLGSMLVKAILNPLLGMTDRTQPHAVNVVFLGEILIRSSVPAGAESRVSMKHPLTLSSLVWEERFASEDIFVTLVSARNRYRGSRRRSRFISITLPRGTKTRSHEKASTSVLGCGAQAQLGARREVGLM